MIIWEIRVQYVIKGIGCKWIKYVFYNLMFLYKLSDYFWFETWQNVNFRKEYRRSPSVEVYEQSREFEVQRFYRGSSKDRSQASYEQHYNYRENKRYCYITIILKLNNWQYIRCIHIKYYCTCSIPNTFLRSINFWFDLKSTGQDLMFIGI